MRHEPFVIRQAERDAWVARMLDALATSGAGSMERAQMVTYLESAATHMINADDETPAPPAGRSAGGAVP